MIVNDLEYELGVNKYYTYRNDGEEDIPVDVNLLCYCPEWNESQYVVAQYDGVSFWYDEDHNGSFNNYVVEWCYFKPREE